MAHSPPEKGASLCIYVNFTIFTKVKTVIVEHPSSVSDYIRKVIQLVVTLHHMWNT